MAADRLVAQEAATGKARREALLVSGESGEHGHNAAKHADQDGNLAHGRVTHIPEGQIVPDSGSKRNDAILTSAKQDMAAAMTANRNGNNGLNGPAVVERVALGIKNEHESAKNQIITHRAVRDSVRKRASATRIIHARPLSPTPNKRRQNGHNGENGQIVPKIADRGSNSEIVFATKMRMETIVLGRKRKVAPVTRAHVADMAVVTVMTLMSGAHGVATVLVK